MSAGVAAYLNRNYGDQAVQVARLAGEGYGATLVAHQPFLEAEVLYAVRHEMAERAIDVLARRTPLALLDTAAARQALPRILQLMQAELGWDQSRCDAESRWAEERLSTAL